MRKQYNKPKRYDPFKSFEGHDNIGGKSTKPFVVIVSDLETKEIHTYKVKNIGKKIALLDYFKHKMGLNDEALSSLKANSFSELQESFKDNGFLVDVIEF